MRLLEMEEIPMTLLKHANSKSKYTSDNKLMETNTLTITGKITSVPELSYQIYGEDFYTTYIEIPRLSNVSDILPVTISHRLINMALLIPGTVVSINGQLRTYNKLVGTKSHLLLSVFTRHLEVIRTDDWRNRICLNGFICKAPIYRETPFGREIADILVAVNRAYGKSDYIPLIAWGRNARYAGLLSVGDNIQVAGRIQSRVYQKKYESGETVDKMAYEVSIAKIEKTGAGL